VALQTILGWLPYVAAARLAEDVAGKADRLLQLARSSRKLYSMILDRGCSRRSTRGSGRRDCARSPAPDHCA
jgi:hypothetical protein